MEKVSKEIKAINDALLAFNRKHGGNVVIMCSVFGFNDESDVVEDSYWMCGNKNSLNLQAETMLEMVDLGGYDEVWE